MKGNSPLICVLKESITNCFSPIQVLFISIIDFLAASRVLMQELAVLFAFVFSLSHSRIDSRAEFRVRRLLCRTFSNSFRWDRNCRLIRPKWFDKIIWLWLHFFKIVCASVKFLCFEFIVSLTSVSWFVRFTALLLQFLRSLLQTP